MREPTVKDVAIFRMWEELLNIDDQMIPVTSMLLVMQCHTDLACTAAQAMSKEHAGTFFIQRNPERKPDPQSVHPFFAPKGIMAVSVGEPDYPTFIAGYQNGKQVFPILGLKMKELER